VNLSIGAWGWKHPEWEKDVFYPDDLPADWQLSYYSNEFDLVAVPASYWSTEGYGDEEWLDDVDDDFVFYIEWPFLQLTDFDDYKKCAQFCDSLGEQLAAVLVNEQNFSHLSPDQHQWFNEVTQIFNVQQFGVCSPQGQLGCVADDLQKSELLKSSDLLLLHSDSSENLRDLSKRLTALLAVTESQYIIVANESPEIERVKELATLVELLA